MPKYASFPKMGKCGKPCKIKGKPIYKEKCEHDKNTIYLPRQDLPGVKNFCKSSTFCISSEVLPTIYQYFWRAGLADYGTKMRRLPN